MKSLTEGECGRSNALVGLSRTYGNTNQRIAPSTRGSSSLLPTNSLGEQFANDFLQLKANSTVAPSSFSLNALSANIPKQSSSSSLANNWTNEYAALPANQLASQWSSQYAPTRPSYSNAWASATGQSTGSLQSLNSGSQAETSSMWSAEYLDNVDTSLQKDMAGVSLNDWASEYSQDSSDVWQTMENEWEAIRKNVQEAQGERPVSSLETNYAYQDNNSFLTNADPMSSGDHLMTSGDLSSSILAYEAAVQKNPQDAETALLIETLEKTVEEDALNADAWCRLGLANAENELDSKAIVAFNNCLKIQPNNQEALLALSVSLANESKENDALYQLEQWITVYEGGNANQMSREKEFYSSFLKRDEFAKVEERFLAAARKQNGKPDASLQNAFGVLYNLNHNYDRAVDCIKLAISSRPEDPRLWNRLGATLANSDQTVEAIAAYREALSRYPNYVRVRYNLGISCMHLNSFREAIDHFISALELQKGGNESHTIWPTLRSATIRMKGCTRELMDALDYRDINSFKSALSRIPNN